MPFSNLGGVAESQWTEIYVQLFTPAIEQSRLGYVCKRSILRSGAFTKDIIQNLKTADVVLADVTFFNANVMWELGVRHALSKKTIMVARHDMMNEKIISDMKIYTVHPYDPTNITMINEFKKIIKNELVDFEKDPDRNTSPVFDFIREEELTLTSIEKRQIINKLVALLNEFAYNLDLAKGLLTEEYNANANAVTTRRYEVDAISHILITNYINGGNDFVILLQKIREILKRANHWLNRLSENKRTGKPVEHSIDVIQNNAKSLEKNLIKSIKMTKKLYSLAKTNSLENEDSSVIIADSVKEYFD